MPYGKIVDTWQRDNVMPAMPEEEYPIYQSASFRRYCSHSKLNTQHFAQVLENFAQTCVFKSATFRSSD